MRRSPVALIPVVGLLILGACTGRDSTAPRGIAPDLSNQATVPGPSTTCDFTATRAAAKNYYTSNQDPVYDYLSSMSQAYKSGGAVAATPYGWTVLGQVVTERLTGATTNGSAGAIFVIDVLRCMADLSTNPAGVPLAIPSDFSSNATLVLNSGIFDIRTGGSTGGPTLGKVESGGVRSFGAPGWGVEAATSSTPWPGTTANPTVTYAVYGYPTTIGTPLLGSPQNINTNDDIQYPSPFNAFQLGSLPDSLPRTGLRVGVCYPADPNAGDGTVNRLVHNNNQILALDSPNQMCPTSNLVASASVAPAWYASLMNHAISFFTPAPLYAKLTDAFDIGGGTGSGWSPFQTGSLTASAIVLTITQQPKNTVVSTAANDTVVVRATFNGTPVPDVLVDSIAVYNNSGTPAGAVITDHNHPYTNGDGLATVTFSVGKAGGYLITIFGRLDNNLTQSVTTQQFQVKNP